MKKSHIAVDGFVPRRSGNQFGEHHRIDEKRAPLKATSQRELYTMNIDQKSRAIGKAQEGYGLGRSDINDSLKQLDGINEPAKKLSRRKLRRQQRQNGVKRPKSLVRRVIKWLIILIIIGILSVGGYVGYKMLNASGSVFQGNIFNIFKSQPLKQDKNGRSNFLILGTSEDDPGHEGANLTDSIMVVSIDQTNKNVYMFSIPRDMTVEYGMACWSGYSGKVNAYFDCVSDGTTAQDEQDRLANTQKLIGDVLGIDIQYGVHVNYTVLKDVINAIGGSITVNIESRNSNGQMDSQLDWMCGNTYSQRIKTCPPRGHYVDYPNGPAVLNAQAALNLARARGDSEPTYGFERSNFDREINQQKILVAIRDKALSNGTLTNLSSITKLIDALGSNLRSNIQISEIRTIADIASAIKSSDIYSLDFAEDNLLSSDGNPTAGAFNYNDIQDYIAKKLSSNPLIREDAPVVVLNGTETAGLGQVEADKLKALGYNIAKVANAPDGSYVSMEVYQIGTGNKATASALEKLYGVKIKTTEPPVDTADGVAFLFLGGSGTDNKETTQ